MNTAFGLGLALPATGALVFIFLDGLGGVVVPDALVASVKEFVIRDTVVLDVLTDLIKGPVGEGVDFNKAGFVDLEDIEVTTLATLASSATSQDCINFEFAVCALSRLNFGEPVVSFVVGFPEAFTVFVGEFFFCLCAQWLIDMDVEVGVSLADTVHKGKSLFKVVQSIQEDEIDHLWTGHIELREHVGDGETSKTKGGGLIKIGKSGNAPSQDI